LPEGGKKKFRGDKKGERRVGLPNTFLPMKRERWVENSLALNLGSPRGENDILN